MMLEELKEKLNNLSWDEQLEFEMSERPDERSANTPQEIAQKIKDLARQITPSLLDILEKEAGYIVWALRLSPDVPGDSPYLRAQFFLHHADSTVRFWAAEILKNKQFK